MPKLSPLAFLALLFTPSLAQSATQLFNFTTYTDIENSALRPNGHLLLTTFTQGRLYDLNPTTPARADLVAALPGATALTGIAAIGPDKFAIAGGVRGNYSYVNETVYTVDFANDAAVEVVAEVPDAVLLNGMAALPAKATTVLLADSRVGCVWRVDTLTGAVDKAFEDERMGVPAGAAVPIGVNGLKIFGGYAYFTNTAKGLFARVAISEEGDRVGEVEVIAESGGASWDDFNIDADGVAYLAQANSALVRVTPDGEKTVVVDDPMILGPTSVNFAEGGEVVYVTTRGADPQSGQVIEVQL